MGSAVSVRGALGPRRMRRTRIAVALVATVSLCLGPAAAAFADDGVSDAQVPAASVADPVAASAPVPEPAPEPAPAPAPQPEPAPAPDPAPAPAPAPSPDPTPDAGAPEQTSAAPGSVDAPAPTSAGTRRTLTPSVASSGGSNGNGNGTGDSNPGENIGICHATGNPGKFVYEAPNANGVVSGHADHQGGRDVIPPFSYQSDGVTIAFAGQNWDPELAAALHDWITVKKCAGDRPTPRIDTPTPTVTLSSAAPCLVEGYGAYIDLEVSLGNLVAGAAYEVVVTRGGSTVSTQNLTATASTAALGVTVVSPGSYTATVTGPGSGGVSVTSAAHAVTTCDPADPDNPMPTIVLSSGLCLTTAEPFAVTAIVESLQAGETYTVELFQGGATVGSETFTADATGMASIDFPVTASGSYTGKITVSGASGDYATDTITVQACEPEEPTDLIPTIRVSAGDQCLPEGESASVGVLVELGNLVVDDAYTLTMRGPRGDVSTTLVADQPTLELTVPVGALGLYSFVITGAGQDPVQATTELVIAACDIVVEPCPGATDATGDGEGAGFLRVLSGVFGDGEDDMVRLAVSAAETGCPQLQAVMGECSTTGSTYSVTLEASGLEPGTVYGISLAGPQGYAWSGTVTGDSSGFASTVVLLDATGLYTGTLDGAQPIEFVSAVGCAEQEPPIVPAVVTTPRPAATPTPTATPALAVTGSGGAAGLAWAGILALIAATAVMVAPRIGRRSAE